MIVNNRYKIIDIIGSGAMGEVYSCEDLLNQKSLVALKTVNSDYLNSSNVEQVKKEFEVMTRLKHPNLVRVYDFGYDRVREQQYITMEHAKGVTLDKLFEEKKELSEETIKNFLVNSCRALSFIHSRGIIHRDISPKNIIVDDTFESLKIMDFGLSDLRENDDNPTFKGTLNYCAPEMFTQNVTFSSDIFALGISLFEIVTGEPFYSNFTSQEIIFTLKSQQKFEQHLQERLATVSNRHFREIIYSMCRFSCDERYSHATEVINDLNKFFHRDIPFENEETQQSYVLGAGFVGRESELQNLIAHIEKDEFQAVWVRGEAGVGKSRLFYEFKKYCQLEKMHFIESTCQKGQYLGAILPIVDQLLFDSNETLITKFGPELKKVLSNHHCLKNITVNPTQDPQTERQLVYKNVISFFKEYTLSQEDDTVVFFNDMHLADESSIELLNNLISSLTKDIPLHVFYSSRVEQSNSLSKMKCLKNVNTLILHPFSPEIISSYIEAIFGKGFIGDKLGRSFNIIHQRVGGNPFFLQELLKNLVDKEIVVRNKLSWDLKKEIDELTLPRSVEDVITYRLSSLHIDMKDNVILQTMALLHRWVSFEELSQMTAVEFAYLEFLENCEIIKKEYNDTSTVYALAHDLITDTIISHIENKKDHHLVIAQSLEDIYSGDDTSKLDELAHHYYHSHSKENAKKYLYKAAYYRKSLSDNKKALSLLEKYFHLLDESEESEKLDTMINRAEILEIIGLYEESKNLYEQGIDLARKLEDKQSVVKAYIGLGLAVERLPKEDRRHLSFEAHEKALEVSTEIGDTEGMAKSYHHLAFHYYTMRKFGDSLAMCEKGMPLAEADGNIENMYTLLYDIGRIHAVRRDYEKAIECMLKYIPLCKKSGLRRDLTIGYYELALLHGYIKDYETSLEYGNLSYSAAEEIDYTVMAIFAAMRNIDTLMMLNRIPDAINEFKKVEHHFVESDDYMTHVYGKIYGALVNFLKGDIVRAKDTLLTMLAKGENPSDEVEVNTLLWKITKEEKYRQAALVFYKKKLEETPDFPLYIEKVYQIENKIFEEDVFKSDNMECGSKGGKIEISLPTNCSDELREYLQNIVSGQNAILCSIQKQFESNLHGLVEESLELEDKLSQSEYVQANIDKINFLPELFTVIREMNSKLTLPDLFSKLLDSCIQFLNAERGAVMLLNESGVLEIKAARNNNREDIPFFKTSTTATSMILKRRTPLFFPDQIDDSGLEQAQSIIDMELKSIMCAPLENKTGDSEESLLGMIYLDSRSSISKNGIAGCNTDLLQTIADQAAIAISNTLVNERLKNANERLESMNKQLADEVNIRRKAEKDLSILNESLEEKIKERTVELEEAHKKLVDAAYKAGMADIATATLHNVGNTLTSVVASIQKISMVVHHSNVRKMHKANELLKEHKGNICSFFTEDPRGVKLIDYYLALGDAWAEEQAILSKDVKRLNEKTSIVQKVVNRQIKNSTMDIQMDSVDLVSIIADLEKMLEGILENEVSFVNEFSDVSPVKGYKVKISHVLTSLLNNAVEAIEIANTEEKEIHISVSEEEMENDYVTLKIRDTGCGIKTEDLNDIFTHGFTTKKDHDGFNLHSCANYMTEMGGKIAVESLGENRGATFILSFKK